MHKELSILIKELLRQGNKVKITSEEVKKRFDEEDSNAYGMYIPMWLPDFDYVHGLICDIIRPYLLGDAFILDLGGGTGRMAKLLLDTFPACRILIQDISANMLKETQNKLKEYSGRFECIEGDFFTKEIDFEPNCFDCIISVLAIHHGRDPEAYRDLYLKCYRWLKPTSCFICLDNVAGDTPDLAALNYINWAEALKSKFDTEVTRRIIEKTILEDSPLSLREHLAILEKCGFNHSEVMWKKEIFGLYLGLKSGG